MGNSIEKVKINTNPMLLSRFASEHSERAEIFDILAHKTNEKHCKMDEKSEN